MPSTMTHSGYLGRQASATSTSTRPCRARARTSAILTPLVLMDALRHAGTCVHEPIHRFRVEMPADTYGAVVPLFGRLRAIPRTQEVRGSAIVVEGDVPAAQAHDLRQRLVSLTRGEGVLENAFDRYEPVSGAVPTRSRTDRDPLNREMYLLRIARRA